MSKRVPERDTLEQEWENIIKTIASVSDLTDFGDFLSQRQFLSVDAVSSILEITSDSKLAKTSKLMNAVQARISAAGSQEISTKNFNQYILLLNDDLGLEELAGHLTDRNKKLSAERNISYTSPLPPSPLPPSPLPPSATACIQEHYDSSLETPSKSEQTKTDTSAMNIATTESTMPEANMAVDGSPIDETNGTAAEAVANGTASTGDNTAGVFSEVARRLFEEEPAMPIDNEDIKDAKQQYRHLKSEYVAFRKRVSFVICVANPNEYNAATTVLQAPDIEKARSDEDKLTNCSPGVYIGMISMHPVGLIWIDQGREAEIVLQNTLPKSFPNAKFLVACGMCYGFHPEIAKFGDVIIADKILASGSFKKEEGIVVFTGNQINMKSQVKKIFCNNPRAQKFLVARPERHAKYLVGKILSGAFLVKEKKFKIDIMRSLDFKFQDKNTYGGEMEGEELLKMQGRDIINTPVDVEVIVIKGVADYGTKDKNKKWQFIASKAAFHYVQQKLLQLTTSSAEDGVQEPHD